MLTVEDVFDAVEGLGGARWGNMEAVLSDGKDLLDEISSKPELLSKLIGCAREDVNARSNFERHRLLDKLHLFESPTNGVRLRLHISTNEHKDRPHDHRFSFVSKILTGGYMHTRHELEVDDWGLIDDTVQNDTEAVPLNARVIPTFQTYQAPGSLYSLHHSEIHTTFTRPQSVSLFLRGPAEKQRSIITERETSKAWWRYGKTEEPQARRQKVSMDERYLDELLSNIRSIGVIK
ncbi:hypothetical protein [Rhodococcus sp. P1Y]|uniref:hypothetical protein n=1 Tax=Rhodococcus sp. P1Y TaxID=1302308 RepID=UPI001292E872|nr:hypothetical protein [Rhodococcus sp. P1Y]